MKYRKMVTYFKRIRNFVLHFLMFPSSNFHFHVVGEKFHFMYFVFYNGEQSMENR